MRMKDLYAHLKQLSLTRLWKGLKLWNPSCDLRT